MRVFIGSSDGARKKAEVLRSILKELGADVVCWYDPDPFLVGDVTIDSLIKQARTCQAAVFVLNADDKIKKNGQGTEKDVPRDNVITEVGFFIGALGKNAVALCCVPDVHIPTDFAGITYLKYDADDRAYMQSKLGPWLKAVHGDRPPKTKNNLIMSSRQEIHDLYPIESRLHMEDGGYKHIKKLRLMNIASSLSIDPQAADANHQPGMASALEKILQEGQAVMEFMLLEPHPHNLRSAATQIANPTKGTKEEVVRSAWESLYYKLSSATVYREAYEMRPKRFLCFSLNVGLPYALFQVEFAGEYQRYDHVKIDLYSPEIGNEDERRSFIIWKDLDRENYDFFVQNFNRIKGNIAISHQPTIEEIKGWITEWNNTPHTLGGV